MMNRSPKLIFHLYNWFSEGPFFSKVLASVRFSKFERFELPMNFQGKGFCAFSRRGESVLFPIRHIEVRILPPSHPFICSARSSKKRENGPEIPAFRYSISSPGSRFADVEVEIAESLWPCARKFPFCGDYRRRLV